MTQLRAESIAVSRLRKLNRAHTASRRDHRTSIPEESFSSSSHSCLLVYRVIRYSCQPEHFDTDSSNEREPAISARSVRTSKHRKNNGRKGIEEKKRKIRLAIVSRCTVQKDAVTRWGWMDGGRKEGTGRQSGRK